MKELKGYRFRIYPDEIQKSFSSRHLVACGSRTIIC
ncbi:helix-turn-helix domain-containing protein [Enterococcus alcedinis]